MVLHWVLGIVGIEARALGGWHAMAVVVEQLALGARAARHALVLSAVLLPLLTVPARPAHRRAHRELLAALALVPGAVW
jgi:hypothetical protein